MTTQTRASTPQDAAEARVFPPPRPKRRGTGRIDAVAADVRQLWRYRAVVQNMVVQELRVRYQRSMLGFLWTLLNPVLMMATMSVVFAQLFGVSTADYAIFLFAGMVPWNFLSNSTNDCAFCIIFNESLIRKIYLPKMVFPLSRVLINLTTFVLSMGALFLLMQPLGTPLSWSLLLLPVVVALFAVFTLGLGLIVAIMNTFYRDTGHLVTVFLQAWYFATPIIYRASFLPEEARWRFWLNPAYPFMQLFQQIISEGRCPTAATFGVAAGIALTSLGIGYAAFKSFEDRLVFRL